MTVCDGRLTSERENMLRRGDNTPQEKPMIGDEVVRYGHQSPMTEDLSQTRSEEINIIISELRNPVPVQNKHDEPRHMDLYWETRSASSQLTVLQLQPCFPNM